MLSRARQSVYWPDIEAEVEQKRLPTPPPQYPFQQERSMCRSTANASLRYDQSAHDFTPLEPGQRTLIQNPATGRWDLAGTIMEQTTPRVPDMARWQRWGYT
ncbi:hypothetical protein Pcinc_008746 [Petrolisthes cinctipes]|uniref:Uncharacterized protein n=1 Tax=Petrolisthes cinctipes TaxID=88211 RepID=A0AAE1G895_PETCI|nr:hypothetical protein Pcinc_008746 [Petrolisthes cinctipes]